MDTLEVPEKISEKSIRALLSFFEKRFILLILPPVTGQYIQKYELCQGGNMGKIKDSSKVRWNLKVEIIRKFGSETEFARKLGISRMYLSHIIMGRYPGYYIRKKAVELLGLPEEYLFTPPYQNQKHKIGD